MGVIPFSCQSGAAGSESKTGTELSENLNNKIETHPCYSKNAHQYARLHLPVAPACNIQCNYCNRKFDCSNESRPGVVSRLQSPAQAVARFKAIKKRIPETKVVGIAGPGDALANPNATLTTLKAIAALDEEMHLCISTNGLALLEWVPALTEVGVSHLTITINAIDAEVGRHIYPWVYYNHKRLRGREAAQTLIDRQLAGLSAAAEAGMLVKVNSVLIPGINDQHIDSVATEIKQRGALLHNIMPLISDPAHGTYFGVTGQPEPNDALLKQVRQRAGVDMPQMSHCQQCRADAVGKLDSADAEPIVPEIAEYSETNLAAASLSTQGVFRIAIASKSGEMVDQHFGHAERFRLYELSAAGHQELAPRQVAQYCIGSTECDDAGAESRLEGMLNALKGCDMVLCSRIGLGPWQALEQNGIRPSTEFAMLSLSDALSRLQRSLDFDTKVEESGPTTRICSGEGS